MAIPPYPLVPAPSTYVNGPVTASELTADMTNGVTFLSNRPVFSAYNSEGPAILTSAATTVGLDTELIDTWSGHGTVSGSNYYCQAAGWYLVEGYAPWENVAAATAFQTSIGGNVASLGGSFTSGGQEQTVVTGRTSGQFAADLINMTQSGPVGESTTDHVSLVVSTSGTALVLLNTEPSFPRLTCRWMGTGSASALAVPGNAAFPVPPGTVNATWLNTNVSNAVGFLSNPPMLRYYYTVGGATLASGVAFTGIQIPLNTVSLDNYGSASAGSYTIPVNGIYYVYAQVGVAGGVGASSYGAGVTYSGTTVWGDAIHCPYASPYSVVTSTTARLRFYAGQQISLSGFQDSGVALNIHNTSRLILAWESS